MGTLTRNVEKITANFAVSAVPVDGLVPLGATTSADTVLMKFRVHIDG